MLKGCTEMYVEKPPIDANFLRNFGVKVKNFRELKGQRQEDLAKKCGLPADAIYEIERGMCKDISIQKIHQIANELEIEIQQLFILDDL